jgi:hypothetical protein
MIPNDSAHEIKVTARLYRRSGFREWGKEPRAIQWEGRFVAEHHLVRVRAG